jgi:hypothetical protein
MKIKLDENVPFDLAIPLRTLGYDVHTAHEEGLTGHADSEIWRTAQKESRFLITQDLDFSDLRLLLSARITGFFSSGCAHQTVKASPHASSNCFKRKTLSSGPAVSL